MFTVSDSPKHKDAQSECQSCVKMLTLRLLYAVHLFYTVYAKNKDIKQQQRPAGCHKVTTNIHKVLGCLGC